MRAITSTIIAEIAALLVHGVAVAVAAEPGPQWKPLFNGKNLDGWSVQ